MTKIQEQRIISPRTAQDPINPSGSRLDPVIGSTMGMQSVKDRPNWNTRNGGYRSG